MPKAKITWKIHSYGLYTEWDRQSKALPKIKKFTKTIPSKIGIEFGYILEIIKAKGKKLDFCIHHPPFTDSTGNIAPSFTGEVYVKTNDWRFFLGDTIWEPEHDKIGTWRLTIELEGKVLADESFEIIEDS